jgi:hypothetical protein
MDLLTKKALTNTLTTFLERVTSLADISVDMWGPEKNNNSPTELLVQILLEAGLRPGYLHLIVTKY